MRGLIIQKATQKTVVSIGQNSGAAITVVDTGDATAHWHTEPFGDGTFKISSDWAQGKVWDVAGGFQSDGTPLIIWPWHGGPNQRFRIDGESIIAAHSGKRIGVMTLGFQRLCQISESQGDRFRVAASPMVSINSHKVLDVPWASTENGVQLCQYGLHGGPNQRFLLDEVSRTEPLFRIVAEHSGKVLDVEKASKENGARIIQWPWHGGDNQIFWVARSVYGRNVEGGVYAIINVLSRKAIDVWEWGKDDGAPIVQWDWHGGANQRWSL